MKVIFAGVKQLEQLQRLLDQLTNCRTVGNDNKAKEVPSVFENKLQDHELGGCCCCCFAFCVCGGGGGGRGMILR